MNQWSNWTSRAVQTTTKGLSLELPKVESPELDLFLFKVEYRDRTFERREVRAIIAKKLAQWISQHWSSR